MAGIISSSKYISGGPVYTTKQKTAMAWPLNSVTGSLQFTDGSNISDAGGHERITFTDAGSTLLKNATGVTGYTLDSSNNTTIAGNLEIQGSIGFYDSAPAVQSTGWTQTYSTADKTIAALASSDAAGGAGVTITDAEYDNLRADMIDNKNAINAIIDALQAVGLIA